MKTLYKILVPKFLRNFDNYLLYHYPVIWRTKAIFVVIYGAIVAVLLFTSGFFYPVDAQHLTVDPIEPIEIGYDTYHLQSVIFIFIGVFYWAYRQYQFGFAFTKNKDTLMTILLYALCFWFLLGIITPAFRWGTIYKTAYHWINNEDLDYFKKSGIYPYGFILLSRDTIDEAPLKDTSFLRREIIFKEIYMIEDSLFEHQYEKDSIFWINWFKEHQLSDELDMYMSNLLESSHRSFLSHLSFLSSRSHRINLSDLSYWYSGSFSGSGSYLPYLSYQSYHLNRTDQTELLLHSYQSFRSNLSFRSNWLFRSYQSAYNKYKAIQESDNRFTPYKFKNTQDSILITFSGMQDDSQDSFTIYRPSLPYSVENSVHSVNNARMYWQEHIYIRHWQLLLSYILLLSVLFYFIPFLTLRHLFIIIALCTMVAVIIAFLIKERYTESIGRNISNASYLILPTISCFWIVFSTFKRRQVKGFTLAIQGLFTGLLFVLIGVLFIIFRSKLNFGQIYNYQAPFNFAFYGVQVLGVIGAMLTTYVRTLPKQ